MTGEAILAESEVFRVVGAVEGAEETAVLFDAIFLQGALFLVPEWLTSADGTQKRPTHIVGIAPRAYSPLDRADGEAVFRLTNPVPRSALDGWQAPGYAVVPRPSVRVILSRH
jgi:hypothetical protein